eukprot:1526222-Pleurochrysis_carterae.AAC.1
MAAVPAARTFPLSCDPEALVGRIVTLMRIEVRCGRARTPASECSVSGTRRLWKALRAAQRNECVARTLYRESCARAGDRRSSLRRASNSVCDVEHVVPTR